MLNDVQIGQDGLGSLPPLLYLVSLDHLSPDPLATGIGITVDGSGVKQDSKGLNDDIRGPPLKLGGEIKKFLWSRLFDQT